LSLFVVITGLPGSGKSTLGAPLAAALKLPLIDKDAFLEQLFELEHAASRHELSRRADELFRRAAELAGGAVLVSWWRHPHSLALSGTPTDWLVALPGAAVEVHCTCSPAIATSRFLSRTRHPRHEDERHSHEKLSTQLSAQAQLGPLGVAPLIRVNAEEPFAIPAILRDIEDVLGHSRHGQPAT
jgi:cytidylate kinase